MAAHAAWLALSAIVSDPGMGIPCKGPERGLWGSDDAEQRAQAVVACRRCPALHACAAYAERAGEPFGVWGARDRTRQVVTDV